MDIRWIDGKVPPQYVDRYICDDRTQTYISHADKIKSGTKVLFRPLSGLGLNNVYKDDFETIGTIVYVNHEHNWFSVEYGDDRSRASFNFGDIGYTITLL